VCNIANHLADYLRGASKILNRFSARQPLARKPVSYTFRIRLNRSPRDTIQTELFEINVATAEDGISVFLRAALPQKPSLKDAEQWVLSGEGYSSENEALEAGTRFQDALMIALARMRIGADFGDRGPKGQFTSYGLQSLEGNIKQRVLNNAHGLMVYSADPKPVFVAWEGWNPLRGVSLESFESEFSATIALNRRLTDRERLAFSLFNASFFQPAADSRFLLLTMAVEALIEPVPKSTEAVRHVDGFIKEIKHSTLQQNEKQSLIGSLKWLRDESINKAGQRLAAERLGNKIYGGKTAPAFFSEVYSTRSNLVHGKVTFPTFQQVNAMAATLEVFVSDLLTA